MATNYSVEQYDQTFTPKRLQMYEVPKANLSKTPKKGNVDLNFIADQKGHLLPGVSKSQSNPFGDFIGTWDLPKSIPGPYQLTKTGRRQNNIDKLCNKRLEAENFINEARENQKPLQLRSASTNRVQ